MLSLIRQNNCLRQLGETVWGLNVLKHPEFWCKLNGE